MYLSKLGIKNFRKAISLEVTFQDGINVIVGENNVGKTTIIDALRILLTSGDDEYINLTIDDINHEAALNGDHFIQMSYTFSGLSLVEEAALIEALVPVETEEQAQYAFEAQFVVRFEKSDTSSRLRQRKWCGKHEADSIPAGLLDNLRAVYLKPLRDPTHGLMPGRRSQVARLIKTLGDKSPNKKTALETLVKSHEDQVNDDPLVKDTESVISRRLNQILGEELCQSVSMSLSPSKFEQIANKLSLLADELDIELNGLGYNNVLYTATVLGQLQQDEEHVYRALLIEEPEAHLHPQLQSLLLRYLNEQILLSGASPEEAQETQEQERIQVILSSHSPSFACLAPVDSIISVHHGDGNVIRACSVASIQIEKKAKNKLQRFLDATRAELFFAKRLILVEGIAEAILLPVLAKRIGKDIRVHGLTIVNVSGLNFDAFKPLFSKNAIRIPVSLITDSDPKPKDTSFPALQASIILESENDYISIFKSIKTFEYDLMLHEENLEACLKAFENLMPISAKSLREQLSNIANHHDKAVFMFKWLFLGDNPRCQKGEFAQELSSVLLDSEDPVTFIIPPYIEKAIDHVIPQSQPMVPADARI